MAMQKKVTKVKKSKGGPKLPKKFIPIALVISLGVSAGVFFYTDQNILTALIAIFVTFFLLTAYYILKAQFRQSVRIKQIEEIFPDFLQLMASNLRAGMTTDRALLLSSRNEFGALDAEIQKVGKELVTGRTIDKTLLDMGDRIQSDKIKKTINLIVSGIRTGGNLAILLEETSSNMRERNFLEKRASSNVLMYVIFVVFATAIGSPALFSLSSVLVQILHNLLASIPVIDTTTVNLPFTLTSISISPEFIFYYAIIFLLTTDILGSLIVGLVSKGEEKAGVKYMIPIIVTSMAVFFIIRILLLSFFEDLIG